MIQNLAAVLRLMLVTDDDLLEGRNVVEVCRRAERGGVTAVQLRLKQVRPGDLVEVLRRLKSTLTIPVVVNDRLDVALAGAADGVHLGADDVPVELARRVAPPGFIIGASVGSPEEEPNGRDADYWGIGPYRWSGTKPDAGPALGPEGVGRIIELARPEKPCIAIGGVEPGDVPRLLKTGAVGVAVVSGILGKGDAEVAARAYRECFEAGD